MASDPINWIDSEGLTNKDPSAETGGAGSQAGDMVGRSGNQTNFKGCRAETIISVQYKGHAVDQMRNRGYTPTVIENAINNYPQTPYKNGTFRVYDSVNGINVIINQKGQVITVFPGK